MQNPSSAASARNKCLEWVSKCPAIDDPAATDYPVDYYWDDIEIDDTMPFDDHTAPVVERVLTLHSLFYLISSFDSGVLTHMVDFCLGAVGNYRTRLWGCIFRCGFTEDSFRESQQIIKHLFQNSDLFGGPMFPGGAHLLDTSSSRLEKKFVPIEGAASPSMVNLAYDTSPYSTEAQADGLGNVIFPLCVLNDMDRTRRFLTNYFEGVLRHLWSDYFGKIKPRLVMRQHNDCRRIDDLGEVWSNARFSYHRIRTKNVMNRALEKRKAGAKIADSGVSLISELGDIEDFPKCLETTISSITGRAPSHPKDPERYLIFGTLAFRMEEQALVQLSRKLDTDGSKEGENHLKARTKKTTPSCQSTLNNGLCPYDEKGRQTMCYSRMGTQSFHSPVYLLGKNK